MTTFSERLAILIDAKTSGAVSEIRKVAAASDSLGQGSDKARSSLDKLGISSSAALTAGVTVGLIAAAGAVVKFGISSVSAFSDATAQVRAFQRVSGASAEDASRLVAAFNVLGVDSDQAGTAVFRLAHNLDANREKLAGMGVQVAQTAKGNVDLTNTFLNVADAVHAVGAGFEADSIVAAAFGSKVGASLLPVLLRGRDGLKEFFDQAQRAGLVFSEADLRKGVELKLAVKDLEEQVKGLKVKAGREAIPFVTAFVQGVHTWVDAAETLSKNRAVNDAVNFATPADELDKLSKASNDARASQAGLIVTEQMSAAAHALAAKAAEDEAKALQADRDAITSYVTSGESLQDALAARKTAHDKLAEAMKAGEQKTKDLAAANHDLEMANRDVASAQDALNKAQRDAPFNLAKANDAAAVAADEAAQKERDLAVAVEKHGVGTLDAKKAADDLALSRDNAAQAARDAQDLNLTGKTPQSVLDAEKALTSAQDQRATAQDRLTKAQREDPTATVAAAQRDLDAAERGVASAVLSQKDAQDKLRKAMEDGSVTRDKLNSDLAETTKLLQAQGVDPKLIGLMQNAANLGLVLGGAGTGNIIPGLGLGSSNPEPGLPRLSAPGSAPPAATAPGIAALGGNIGTYVHAPITVQTNASPHDIAHELAFLGRAR